MFVTLINSNYTSKGVVLHWVSFSYNHSADVALDEYKFDTSALKCALCTCKIMLKYMLAKDTVQPACLNIESSSSINHRNDLYPFL